MSRTYNTPPSVLRTKMRELGLGIRAEAKMLISWPWTALKMGFESVLRSGRPESSILDDRPQQFFGLGSITQRLLDNAESDRRCGLPADPFETLAGRPSADVNRGRPAPKPTVKKFHAARHVQD
jgi:hypothetical protein